MELVHDFTVPVPADQAFDLLVDVQRIAPCMPGAVITSVDGDSFEGGMKIKLGPISMTFRGDGELIEKDPEARRAVIRAQGRDAKGNGGAQATVTAALTEQGGTTGVHVVTDLNVTGKAAQFGGGVMKDVSNRMLAQFADNLSQMISAGATATPTPAITPAASSHATAGPTTAAATAPAFTPNDDGLDAMGLLLGSDAVKNVARPALVGLAGLVIGYLYGKNRVLERTVRRGC
ncbi:SRPBCC family protein [Nocardioides kongjuensis]|uniref:Carbon monoxide dehydrogenase subunit G n=1 Tax=Nocardioides kongjuensis TaxID=349522 RepID=A0A852RKF2_9ACTN|nr:SRPBCC family protein [Nocardioides kongjuensis]NYD29330.1 carbon monoxide dehydrogenase subunit G [Nocardioides kongjuensis]